MPARPVFPPGRYGRRRDPVRLRRRRWLRWAAASLVVAAGLLVAGRLYLQYARAPYDVRVISVTDLTDSGLTVTFAVRAPAGQPAECTVRAHSRDGREVGRASVPVPATTRDGERRVTYTLATTGRPVTGEVPRCGPPR
jgi:hypothetical protein